MKEYQNLLSTDFRTPHLHQRCSVNSEMTKGLLPWFSALSLKLITCKTPLQFHVSTMSGGSRVWKENGLQTLWKLQSQIALKTKKLQVYHIYSEDLILAISAHTSLIIFQAGRFEKYFLVNTVKHKKLPGPKNDSKGSILLMVVCSHPALYSCSSVSTWVLWYLYVFYILAVLKPDAYLPVIVVVRRWPQWGGLGWGGMGW